MERSNLFRIFLFGFLGAFVGSVPYYVLAYFGIATHAMYIFGGVGAICFSLLFCDIRGKGKMCHIMPFISCLIASVFIFFIGVALNIHSADIVHIKDVIVYNFQVDTILMVATLVLMIIFMIIGAGITFLCIYIYEKLRKPQRSRSSGKTRGRK